MGMRLVGPDSVEQLVKQLVRIIAVAPDAGFGPTVGRLSSHDISSTALQLLKAILLVLGECCSVSSTGHTACSKIVNSW